MKPGLMGLCKISTLVKCFKLQISASTRTETIWVNSLTCNSEDHHSENQVQFTLGFPLLAKFLTTSHLCFLSCAVKKAITLFYCEFLNHEDLGVTNFSI